MKQDKNSHSSYNEPYESFPISFEPIKAGVYNIYMFGEIESPQQFIAAIEVMRQCTEMDTVVIHLQSCGGSLDATDTLLQAIDECEGQVVVRATGGCHSAASLILLRADTFTLSQNFNSLIHNGSLGNGGKFSDYKSKAVFDVKYFERIMHENYEGFLTEHEIDDVLAGKDLWLDAQQWVERHQTREAVFQGKAEEIVAKMQKDSRPKKPRTKKTAVEEV